MTGGWSYIVGGYAVSFVLIAAYEVFLLTRRVPPHLAETGPETGTEGPHGSYRNVNPKNPPSKGGGG